MKPLLLTIAIIIYTIIVLNIGYHAAIREKNKEIIAHITSKVEHRIGTWIVPAKIVE